MEVRIICFHSITFVPGSKTVFIHNLVRSILMTEYITCQTLIILPISPSLKTRNNKKIQFPQELNYRAERLPIINSHMHTHMEELWRATHIASFLSPLPCPTAPVVPASEVRWLLPISMMHRIHYIVMTHGSQTHLPLHRLLVLLMQLLGILDRMWAIKLHWHLWRGDTWLRGLCGYLGMLHVITCLLHCRMWGHLQEWISR